jgi:glyoxylase-like metal-dependent hydrolase (beta-lactamase superfamily II)
MAGEHVWMADTQTPQSHADWLATLARIESLQPVRVIPGHFAPDAPQDLEAVRFTADYIKAYDEEAAKAKNSAELIAAMQQRYPKLGALSSLELSAKVSKGEMKWP